MVGTGRRCSVSRSVRRARRGNRGRVEVGRPQAPLPHGGSAADRGSKPPGARGIPPRSGDRRRAECDAGRPADRRRGRARSRRGLLHGVGGTGTLRAARKRAPRRGRGTEGRSGSSSGALARSCPLGAVRGFVSVRSPAGVRWDEQQVPSLANLAVPLVNLPVPPDPLHWSASRTRRFTPSPRPLH